VVFGKASGFAASFDASSLNGANGFRIDGQATDDFSGRVSGTGDFNGDGFADLIVGAQGADSNGTASGASYVVFGKEAGFGAVLNLSSLDGSNGFKVVGEAAFDASGIVSAAGDINRDGFADLIIGAPNADPNGANSGAAYVLFGHSNGTIEARGNTTLAVSANHFQLLQNGSGPMLKFSGQDVAAGQFGDWTPIAAEQTASGYEIAWKSPGSNLFSIWNTDANGNYIANVGGSVSGSDPTLLSAEYVFHQDLNGDGRVGFATIETNGNTVLAASANHFYLLQNGAGPSLKFSSQDVVVGQFGDWTPLAAEHTASGYEIRFFVSCPLFGLPSYRLPLSFFSCSPYSPVWDSLFSWNILLRALLVLVLFSFGLVFGFLSLVLLGLEFSSFVLIFFCFACFCSVSTGYVFCSCSFLCLVFPCLAFCDFSPGPLSLFFSSSVSFSALAFSGVSSFVWVGFLFSFPPGVLILLFFWAFLLSFSLFFVEFLLDFWFFLLIFFSCLVLLLWLLFFCSCFFGLLLSLFLGFASLGCLLPAGFLVVCGFRLLSFLLCYFILFLLVCILFLASPCFVYHLFGWPGSVSCSLVVVFISFSYRTKAISPLPRPPCLAFPSSRTRCTISTDAFRTDRSTPICCPSGLACRCSRR
jgi:hypothetical protein